MRISVLITTYNRAALVGEAVESVLAQTRPADEIIVIDDGSTDDTAARLAAFGDRIRVVAKANGGVSSARNAGLAAASGDWITFLDDDDVWVPERLAILERDVADAPPEIAAHLANVRYVGEGYVYDVMEMYKIDAPKGSARRVEDFFATAARGLQMNGLAVRRAVIEEIGGFDESLSTHEDKLFSGLLAHGRPWLVTGDLVSDVRRIDAQSLTELSGRDMEKRLAIMLEVNDRLLALGVTGRNRRLLTGHPAFLADASSGAAAGGGPAGAARARLIARRAAIPRRSRAGSRSFPPWCSALRAAIPAGEAFRPLNRDIVPKRGYSCVSRPSSPPTTALISSPRRSRACWRRPGLPTRSSWSTTAPPTTRWTASRPMRVACGSSRRKTAAFPRRAMPASKRPRATG